MRKIAIISLVALVVGSSGWSFELGSDLKKEQIQSLIKMGNKVFSMRPLNGASSKGTLFGLELGLTANATDISELTGGADQVPGMSDLPILVSDMMPAPQLYGAIGIPFGIGLEFQTVYLPTISGVGFYSYGLNLFWATDEAMKAIPGLGTVLAYVPGLYLSPRFTYSRFQLTMEQEVTRQEKGVAAPSKADATVEGSTYGANLSLSYKFPPALSPVSVEPYVGAGFLSESGEASANVLVAPDPPIAGVNQLSDERSFDESSTALHYFAGLQLRLFLFALTAEYDNVFGADSYNIKLSLKF